jgi:hypothetical protein
MAYEDLLKDTSVVDPSNKDYFLLTITDLDINTTYPIQFRWAKNDKTFGPWSVSKIITTPGESSPGVPSQLTVVGGQAQMTVTWDGKSSTGSTLSNIDRLDIYIDGAPFDASKPADYMLSAGTKTIVAPAGDYIVAAYAVSKAGTRSAVNDPVTVTVTSVAEPIQSPVAPSASGFTSARVLSGMTVTWNGTYGSAWTGFEAINIYAGTSATLTNGTYVKVGQMTGNKVTNTITIPVDGTYVRYDTPVYIHASSVNKNQVESSIVANVTSQSLGARSAISSDLANNIITNTKLVDDAITAAKISTSAITTTKIADDAITSAKIIANAITADKITSSAITADKIAANAITATKIEAGSIDVTKLSAGTISTNNLESGIITATSYLRAGTKSSDGLTGARIEISSSTIAQTGTNVLPGLYVYNSEGTAVLKAPLSGGLEITGGGNFTGSLEIGSDNDIFKADGTVGIWLGNANYADADFRVSSNGVIRANSGTIGGWTLASSYLKNSVETFQIHSGNSAMYIGPYGSSSHLKISASGGIQHMEYVTVDGQSVPAESGNFTLSPNGNLTLKGTIKADTGYIGGQNGWTISTGSISSAGGDLKLSSQGEITMGEPTNSSGDDIASVVHMSGGFYGFDIFERAHNPSTGALLGTSNIISVDQFSSSYSGTIVLGDSGTYGRTAQVAKSAQISGAGTQNVNDNVFWSPTYTAYKSGGLRNMFTVSLGSWDPDLYPSALNGDVLLVYDPS